MRTDALDAARQAARKNRSERLTWGVVELQVTELDRAVRFWTTTLGLRERSHSGPGVALGTGLRTLFVLHSGAYVPVGRRHLGMYHVALGVPDQNEFSRLMARCVTLNVPIKPVDHLLSKAVYLSDPDGLEIEITLETPERFSRFGDLSQGLVLYDVDGQPHSGRAHLDARTELQHAHGTDLEASLSDGAFLSHLHFKVDALAPAGGWFGGIGFTRNLMLPKFGFADMGAGATYSHRLAMNTWAGTDLQPAPSEMARLVRYTLHVHDPAVMANARDLQPSEAGLAGRDPTGVEVSLIPDF